MQVKKKREKSILRWIYTFTVEFAQEAAAQLLLCCRWLFFRQWWQISDEQLITTIYKKEKAWSYQVDQLSLPLPRRHAEPFAQKNNTDPLQRKWWDLLDMMNTKQNRRRTWGGGVLFLLSPPPRNPPRKNL